MVRWFFPGFSGFRPPLMNESRKTYLYKFDPFKPHFYIVKLGFTGVYITFLISAQKHRLWILVRTASVRRFYRVPTIYVFEQKYEKYQNFLCENFQFLVVKFSIYLNRRGFEMDRLDISEIFLKGP